MPELLIRPSGGDVALVERLYAPGAIGMASPQRLVLDAVTAMRRPGFALVARRAGVPVLVDPQTTYLQARQHDGDEWADLPYGTSEQLSASQLLDPARQRQVVEASVRHQLQHGATAVLAPSVHIATLDEGLIQVQQQMLARTRRYLDSEGLRLPLIAVLDVGWRLLDRTSWPTGLGALAVAADGAQVDEIALAGSNVAGGVRPAGRLAGLTASIEMCAGFAPVIAWRQGLFGEACVAAGAIGYETGIGWLERYDAKARMADRRAPAPERTEEDRRSGRPVYIQALGRSIPLATVKALTRHRGVAADLPCDDLYCCPDGVAGLVRDSRAHALRARARSLNAVATTDRSFRWRMLSARAEIGLDLARRINVIAAREKLAKVDLATIAALVEHASMRQAQRPAVA